MSPLAPLPIDDHLAEISRQLLEHPMVLVEAPPGSGKSTRIAPFLLNHVGRSSKRIYLLQPRRVAARSIATRIAMEQGWQLGEQVGYQVRFEKRAGQSTPLIVATEGVLLRRLQSDAVLDDVSLVIFDEFHERSLTGDVLLGMLRRVQMELRSDLKLLLMSATLAASSIYQQLGNIPLVTANGTCFPVDIRYRPNANRIKMHEHVVDTILLTVDRGAPDILVFLPGVGEIHAVLNRLKCEKSLEPWDLIPLHGSQPLEQQAEALRRRDRPRMVLATNVAETSLTLEGIRTVIDSGQVRVLRFDPHVGLDRLQLESTSIASTMQRAGRAGRTESGVCIRLWDEVSQRSRLPFLEPEVRRIDISSAILQLYAWGETEGSNFPWPEAPRKETVQAAMVLLIRLGAVFEEQATELGKLMTLLPVSPRLARLMIESHRRGVVQEASVIAAMLSQREPFQNATWEPDSTSRALATRTRPATCDSDTLERLRAIQNYWLNGVEATPFGKVHRSSIYALRETAQHLESTTLEILGRQPSISSDVDIDVMRALLAAFPDRLAVRRETGKSRGLMVGGKGVILDESSGVRDSRLFLCIDLQDRSSDALVRQASHVEEDWLQPELLTTKDELFFHPSQKQVVARRRKYWLNLPLGESPISVDDTKQCEELLFQSALMQWDQVVPLREPGIHNFINRVACLRNWLPDLNLPELDRPVLQNILRNLCQGKRSLEQVRQSPWMDWIRSAFTSDQLRVIDREAPERVQVPSGKSFRLEYELGKPPRLAVKIQDVFTWKETPRIAMGKVPILLHLLAPNMRPQQITDDLASFWKNTYDTVRKELKRRYPKHAWPDDPLTATPWKNARA